jgi:hypothetical protein
VDAQHYNKLYACTFRKRRRDDYLKRLDLAEHDIISPVVELHRVVVAHGVVAAEVDTLLKNTCYQRRLRMSSFTFVINYRINYKLNTVYRHIDKIVRTP